MAYNKNEDTYLGALIDVLENGTVKEDRTGTGTRSIFGYQMRFNLADGFPLLTTKRVHFKSIAVELLWFLRGETNTAYLKDNGVSIWDEWADENGDLGPVYGQQWRSWPVYERAEFPYEAYFNENREKEVDQIKKAIDTLKNNPDDRGIIVSAWNVGELDNMKLRPCHAFFQLYSKPLGDGKRGLSLQVYQRSADIFLGVPFNIASYGLLLLFLAQVTAHEVEEFIWTGGDVHLYSNHIEQALTQIEREPMEAPKVTLSSHAKEFIAQYNDPESKYYNNLDALILSLWHPDFILEGYEHHPSIKAPVAV